MSIGADGLTEATSNVRLPAGVCPHATPAASNTPEKVSIKPILFLIGTPSSHSDKPEL
jgi:hypothetical protein